MPLLIDIDPDDDLAERLRRGEAVEAARVQLGGEEYEMPERFALKYQPTGDEPAWRMDFQVRDGVPQCRRLVVEATDSGRDIRSVDLRLSVEGSLELAGRHVAVRRTVDESGRTRLVRDLGDLLSGATLRAVRRTRQAARRTVTDEVLRDVAEVYRRNVADNPTEAVRAHLGVADRTARLYVRRARDAGFLGEALPGKAGER
ncbi:MAG: hypothetical protein ACRDT6_16535 [Micromonosporaceae bacterium]